MHEYFTDLIHIIYDILVKIGNYDGMSNVESFTSSIANLTVVGAGVTGIIYCQKWKEKQMNATFSYLVQLQVRIKPIYDFYKKYQDNIMDRLYIPKERSEDITDLTPFIGDLIQQFSASAEETIVFLKQTGEQMPACREWPELYVNLLTFLNDMKQISNKNYHKWNKPCEESEQYKVYHIKNMELMLKAIEERQKKITKRIFPFHPIMSAIKAILFKIRKR